MEGLLELRLTFLCLESRQQVRSQMLAPACRQYANSQLAVGLQASCSDGQGERVLVDGEGDRDT